MSYGFVYKDLEKRQEAVKRAELFLSHPIHPKTSEWGEGDDLRDVIAEILDKVEELGFSTGGV
ncbi:MAG: hypothetical protein ACWGQW_25240 [bacterium]